MTPPRDFLEQACAAARKRVAQARAVRPDAALRGDAHRLATPPSFAAALAGSDVAVIAEIKRASPSRGPLAEILDPPALARAYAEGGAAAISVLTEPQWFAGSLDDLAAVAVSVDVPILRKDFVVDAYQLYEARSAGAAAALLIVAALDDTTLRDLLVAADDAGLDALVEIHDEDEARRAVAASRAAETTRRLVVGVNARDLTTLTVDTTRFAGLAQLLRSAAPDAVVVAESGVAGPVDVTRLKSEGADAVLVGEHVATAADPAVAVGALVTAGATSTIGTHP